MNKYVTPILVLVILCVGLAEIYLALSWDQHAQGGRWNITLNWTVQQLPDSDTSLASQQLKVLHLPQDSSKPVVNSKSFEGKSTLIQAIINALSSEVDNYIKTLNTREKMSIKKIENQQRTYYEHVNDDELPTNIIGKEDHSLEVPDCGFNVDH